MVAGLPEPKSKSTIRPSASRIAHSRPTASGKASSIARNAAAPRSPRCALSAGSSSHGSVAPGAGVGAGSATRRGYGARRGPVDGRSHVSPAETIGRSGPDVFRLFVPAIGYRSGMSTGPETQHLREQEARFTRTGAGAGQHTPVSILARLDRIDVWSLPFLFIGIIGTGFLFTFRDDEVRVVRRERVVERAEAGERHRRHEHVPPAVAVGQRAEEQRADDVAHEIQEHRELQRVEGGL